LLNGTADSYNTLARKVGFVNLKIVVFQ